MPKEGRDRDRPYQHWMYYHDVNNQPSTSWSRPGWVPYQRNPDPDTSNRFGVKEDSINFRPSPNFKNMKKFFKLRPDYEESKVNSTKVTPDPPQPPSTEKSECRTEVQPPLPLDPPPDDDVADNAGHADPKNKKPDVISDTTETESKTKGTKRAVCRDFIRGTCVRAKCRHAHTTDVSQEDLYGLYTFCRDFQSRFCTYANCRYVHATVFEEQEYYRSRYLPPHVFAHYIDNVNHTNNTTMNAKLAKLLMPPPPPPPPRDTSRVAKKKSSVNFTVPPPPIQTEIEKQNMITPMPPDTLKAIPPPMPTSTTLKRDWSIIEQFSNPPCKMDDPETVPKKCKQCDTTEFRLQYNEDKVKQMRLAKEEINKKMAILDGNIEKINKLLKTLFFRNVNDVDMEARK